MLINDKSQLKQNVEQVGSLLALKTSKSLSWSDRLRQTVPYCRTVSHIDLWPCKTSQLCPLIWWILVPSFFQIPLREEIWDTASHKTGVIRQWTDRLLYCRPESWWQNHKIN